MNINDRLALTIGRLVMQGEASAEQITALQKQLEDRKEETPSSSKKEKKGAS